MIKFLLPIAINVINKAVDQIPEDLDDLLTNVTNKIEDDEETVPKK